MFMSHYATEVCKCPDYSLPIASQKVNKGSKRSVTFTLNAGDYVVEANGTQTVQIHEGQESHLYFNYEQ